MLDFPYNRYYLHLQIIKHNILTLGYRGDIPSFLQNDHPDYPLASKFALFCLHEGSPTAIEVYTMARFLYEGPKYFTFNALDCEALENFSLDLPTSEYAQPFPTLCIKLPKDYIQNRVVPFEKGTHYPTEILIHHAPHVKRLAVAIHMSSKQVLARMIVLDLPENLEKAWERSCTLFVDKEKSLDVGPEEAKMSDALVRLALSACLMAMVYGNKKIGPDNPSYAERLKRYVKVAHKSKDPERIAEAEWNLNVLPVRYSFAQNVKLYRKERETDHKGEPTGKHIAPHWRKGHYRMQPYGPHNSLRKRIAIPAVLVNAHLFLGEQSNTQAHYHT